MGGLSVVLFIKIKRMPLHPYASNELIFIINYKTMSNIFKEVEKRILVLDGAMGTMLQAYKFTEEDFRGERFKDYPSPSTRK